MAEKKQAVPNIEFGTMSQRNYERMMAGADAEHPLYKFDAFGNVTVMYENAPFYSPNRLFKNPFTGQQESADSIMDFVNKKDETRKEIAGYINAFAPYNHAYNVDGKLLQGVKSVGSFLNEAFTTIAETATNVVEGVSSVPRTIMETDWQASMMATDDSVKQEIKDILTPWGEQYEYYLKNHDFTNDDISDEAKNAIKKWKNLLEVRELDNSWSSTLTGIPEAMRTGGFAKWLDEGYEGNKLQTIRKIADFGGQIAGSLYTFKAAGLSANAATKLPKMGSAFTKVFGATGSRAVFGTSFFNQYSSLRREGLANGLSYDKATGLAFYGALAEAFIEAKGFAVAGRLSLNKSILNIIKQETIPEALEEMSQTIAENAFTKIYGINDKKLSDIIAEIGLSGLGGAIGGSFVGALDLMRGQVGARTAAARQVRDEKYEQARQKALERLSSDDKAIEDARNGQKQIEDRGTTLTKDDGFSRADYIEEAEIVDTTQKQLEDKKENIPQLEAYTDRIEDSKKAQEEALSRDAEYQHEKALADEEYRKNLEAIVSEKLRKANPNITDEQIKNATSLIFRTALRMENEETVDQAVAQWIEDVANWTATDSKEYQQNLAKLDEELGEKSLGLTQQDLADLKSGDRFVRQNAEWKVVKANIKDKLQQAGVSEKRAQQLADTFENVYSIAALRGNISPTQILEKMGPKIIGLQRAILNGQDIEGLETALGKVSQSTTTNPKEQRADAENIINGLMAEGGDGKSARDNAVFDLIGANEETKYNADDLIRDIESRADVERTLAREMGIVYGKEFSDKDYMVMALMRARGSSQEQINNAFEITGRNDANSEYNQALKEKFPPLSSEELKTAKELMSKANEGTKIKGAFEKGEQDTILIGSENIDDIAAEEFFHYITTNLQDASKMQAVKDRGERLLGLYNLYKVGLFPDIRPLSVVFDSLTKNVIGPTKTDIQLHETLAEAYVRFLNNDSRLSKEQREAFNQDEAEQNDVISVANNSKYDKLSQEQKNALGERLANLSNKGVSGELVGLGNKMANLGQNMEVEKAKEIALDILTRFETYNSPKWAVAFSQWNKLTPVMQLNLIQSFAEEITMQGYDMMVSSSYQVEFDEEGRPTLVKSITENNQSDITPEDNKILFHSETIPQKTDSLEIDKTREKVKFKGVDNEESFWRKIKDWTKENMNVFKVFQEYGQSLSDAAYKAHPIIGATLRQEMFKHSQREQKYQRIAARIPELIKSTGINIDKQAFKTNFKDVLFSGEEGARQKAKLWIMEQFKGTGKSEEVGKAMDDIFNTLNEIILDLRAKGLTNIGYIKEYWPTHVKDRNGFAKALNYANPLSKTEKYIRDLVEELKLDAANKNLSFDELRKKAVDRINSQWWKYNEGEQVTQFHQRGSFFDSSMSDFYEGPFESLARYFEGANRTLLMRSLTGEIQDKLAARTNERDIIKTQTEMVYSQYQLGKINPKSKDSWEKAWKETGVLGQAFAFALTQKGIDMEAMDNFARMMKKFVNRNDSSRLPIFNWWKRTNSALLGNFISTTNQLKEIQIVMSRYGVNVTMEALKQVGQDLTNENKNKDLTSEGIFVQKLNETLRFNDNDWLSNLTDLVHTYSGFSFMDQFMKDVEARAALLNAQKVLRGEGDKIQQAKFQRDFDRTFPLGESQSGVRFYSEKERAAIMEDIKNGNITNDVKFFLFNMMSDIQPINSAEVPAAYNALGSFGKLMYQYKGPAIKQIEFLVNDTLWYIDEFKKGNIDLKDLVKRFMGLFMMLAVVGVPVAVIQNLLRGRKTDWFKTAMFSPLDIVMLNEYTVSTMQKEGIFKGFATQFTPSFRVADDASKDFLRIINGKGPKGEIVRDIPVFGTLGYYWLLGGRDYAKRQDIALFAGGKEEENERYNNALNFVGGVR